VFDPAKADETEHPHQEYDTTRTERRSTRSKLQKWLRLEEPRTFTGEGSEPNSRTRASFET
jgi:hypothetical protein